MKLVNADQLKERIRQLFPNGEVCNISAIMCTIDDCDCVDIVRCKDCRYWERRWDVYGFGVKKEEDEQDGD